MLSRIWLLIICVGLSVGSCTQEPETAIHIQMDGKNPPTFSFSGPWWAKEFKILEMPPRKENRFAGHDFANDKKIWSIVDPDPPPSAAQWPHIMYGNVPGRFKQNIPTEGKPPELSEGKVYSAQAIDNIGNGGLIYFTIRKGNAVEVLPSDVFYDR